MTLPAIRAERHAQFKAMRDRGMLLREIAAETGLSTSYVHDVLNDPTGASVRARKRRLYSSACGACGAEIVAGGPKEIDERSGLCAACSSARRSEQTRAWIVDSIREWARLFGAAPSSVDWNPALARATYCAWKADRHADTGRPWPQPRVVIYHFGTWNAGLRAAGFEPLDKSEHWLGHAGVALMREETAA